MNLIKSSIGNLVLKGGAALIGIINSILLAKLLGPEDFGLYSIIFSASILLGVIVTLGTPSLIVRETAICFSKKQWGELQGLLKMIFRMVIFAIFLASFVVLIEVNLDVLNMSLDYTIAFILISLLALFALNQIRAATLKGFHWVLSADIPDLLIQPATLLLLLVATYYNQIQINSLEALYFLLFSIFIGFLVGMYMLFIRTPDEVKSNNLIVNNYHWLKSTKIFFFIAVVGMVQGQIPIYLLGYMLNTEQVGIFQAANVLVGAVVLGLTAINSPLQPKLAKSWAKRDFYQSQKLIEVSSRLGMGIAIILSGFLIIFSQNIFALYGAEYGGSIPVLKILIAGQIVNAFFGSCMIVLMMTGFQSSVLYGLVFATMVNLFFSLLLIPNMGVEGAAISASLGILVWNSTLSFLVWKKTGMNTLAFFKNSKKISTSKVTEV
jgi:O-antigen/teichoic acid export membrane protein